MNKEVLEKFSNFVFYVMLVGLGILIGILISIGQYNEVVEYANEIIDYANNCTAFTNVGLYKELNDNGLSNETYILNNNGFEVVNIGR